MALDAIYNTLEGQITGTLAGKYAAVTGLVSAPLQTAMAINLVIVGFAVMRGISNEPFGNYLGTWLKCYLVILAATSSLASQIASAAQNAPDLLSGALGGNLSTSFDTFVSNAINPAQSIHNGMEPWIIDLGITQWTIANPVTYVMVIILMVLAYLIAAIAMTMVLFIKFGLFVTIATMPIFVGALIFPSSSGLFFSWLGAVLNYTIQTAAVALILVFVVNVVGNVPGQVGVGGSGATTLMAVEAMVLQMCAIFVGGFLILQAQSIGSFAGGGGSSGAGFLSAIYPATLQRKITNAALGAPRGAARAVGNTAGWSLNRQSAGRAAFIAQAQQSSGRTSMPGASSRPGSR